MYSPTPTSTSSGRPSANTITLPTSLWLWLSALCPPHGRDVQPLGGARLLARRHHLQVGQPGLAGSGSRAGAPRSPAREERREHAREAAVARDVVGAVRAAPRGEPGAEAGERLVAGRAAVAEDDSGSGCTRAEASPMFTYQSPGHVGARDVPADRAHDRLAEDVDPAAGGRVQQLQASKSDAPARPQ